MDHTGDEQAMTSDFYRNTQVSIRNFLYNINTNWRWYLDQRNERMNEDTFIEAVTMTRRSETRMGGDASYWEDFININVYSKSDPDSVVGDILAAVPDAIEIRDYVGGTNNLLGHVEIQRIETANLFNIDQYEVRNITIYYEIKEV